MILVLAYYRCPRLCSLVLNSLAEGLRNIDYEIGQEFEVVTVSIDPRETPELAAAKKQAHVEQYGRPGAEQGWHFLTGDADQIERLADAVGYRYSYDAAKDDFAHASGIMVLTPAGKISRYYYGITIRRAICASAWRMPPRATSARRQRGRCGCCASTTTPPPGNTRLLTMRLVRLGGRADGAGDRRDHVLSGLAPSTAASGGVSTDVEPCKVKG